MPVTATLTNHFKYQAYKKLVDLSADSIKVLLMRTGFSFRMDDHAMKKNIKGSTSRSDISFTAADKTIKTAAGNFITDGYVNGGKITVAGTASNNGVKTIVTVDSALQMTVSDVLVNEGAGAAMTLTGADELATGSGYTQDTKVLTSLVLTEDDANDRAELTCANIIWTAAGGSIGPTPGAILYDDTSTDDTIIGYIDFGGEQTCPDGADFTISNMKIRLS